MAAIEELKRQIELPATIKETLDADEQEFYNNIEELAEQAFDDQCTGANPRYPLIQDLKELYTLAYLGCQTESSPYHGLEDVPVLV